MFSLFPLLLALPSSVLHFPNKVDVSREGRGWPKEQDDHPQLYTSSSLSPSTMRLFQSVIPSLSHFLIPDSTFHQLLVSPNSCHVDVDGLGTFSSRALQMWLIKVEGGVRVGKVTRSGIKLLHFFPPHSH